MFCARCGSEIPAGGAFCAKCGAAAIARPPEDVFRRPGLISLLAILQFLAAAFSLFGGIGLLMLSASSRDAEGMAAAVIGTLFAGLGVAEVICGIGLWQLKRYGRTLQIILASIGLLAIPLGTVISICILIYMFNPGVKVLFSGKSVPELTAAELTHVDALRHGSIAMTVVIVVVAVLGGVAIVGIIAAIAIPGLLRARMSANEASAIGSLRAINSAEASYAAAAGKGGYAIALSVLGTACPGSPQGFISTALAHDPSVHRGYVVRLESAEASTGPLDCNGKSTELDYYATAAPITVGTTGARAFSTSSTATIFFDYSGSPPSRDATVNATARPVQ